MLNYIERIEFKTLTDFTFDVFFKIHVVKYNSPTGFYRRVL